MNKQNLTKVPDLEQITLKLLLQIPEGKVTTYKDIAVALGDDIAARAVGTIMANNKKPEKYPCWRVVYSNGEVGNYSGPGGKKKKISKMENEGIRVKEGKLQNFSKVKFGNFEIDPPLSRLRNIQNNLTEFVKQRPVKDPKSIAGVDVSYGPARVVSAYVEMDSKCKEVIYKKSVRKKRVKFPYIPGYLAFRELPLLNNLLKEIKKERNLADAIFVDGNGLLHPRKAGLATHLGIVIDHPTIGIAKKLLCGKVDEHKPNANKKRVVTLNGKRSGLEVKTYSRANPVYVSIGNKILLRQAGKLTEQVSSYKLPEPLRLAHKKAKRDAT